MSDADLTRLLSLIGAIAGAIGAITGIAGVVFTWLAYRRDRPSVKVRLLAPVIPTGPGYRSDIAWGMVQVVNSGRRPVSLQSATLLLDKRATAVLFTFQPVTIEEGGHPSITLFDFGDMVSRGGNVICARVQDGTGKTHYSPMNVKQRFQLLFFRFLR